jgi:hypothetical protein
MENNYAPATTTSRPFSSSSSFSGESGFTSKNMLIIVLIVLLMSSFLGINLLGIIGNSIMAIFQIIQPLFIQLLSTLGFVTGTVIDKSAEVLHTGGNILVGASTPGLNSAINQRPLNSILNSQPSPDSTTNPIQNPISSTKASWCLVGEYQGKRGCVSITDADKCLSGQVFPNQQMCLNPTMGNPPSPLKSIPE